MASVFLSYEREDAAAAGSIARSLEDAGHSVWWDRHIKGGAQYSDEIEEALKRAEAVVVLWSPSSVRSAWVRDEAAAGRDSGRLVPVLIKRTEPPMGFRQYQAIDLTAWKGRGKPSLADILTAIDGIVGRSGDARADRAGTSKKAARFAVGRQTSLVGAAILFAVAVVLLAFVWQPWRSTKAPPSVAIIPLEQNPATASLAADLLVKLGVLQSSQSETLNLVEGNFSQSPDFVIKVGAGADLPRHASMMLLDRGGTLLWSGEFTEPSTGHADLRQQMAYSLAKVLDCAVQALAVENGKLELSTLKLYLNGCANQSNLLAQDPLAAVAVFAKVSEQAPNFEGAWKKLLLAQIQMMRDRGDRDPRKRQVLRKTIDQARQRHPDIAEASLAEAWLRPSRPLSGWIKLVQQAVEKDPDNPDILTFQSLVHSNVGQLQAALADTRRAVESDPLSPSARDALITAMLNSGQDAAARNELKNSENLWPGATSVLQARFAIEFRVGDAAKALAMLQAGKLGPRFTPRTTGERTAHESYLKARIDPNAKNRSQAILDARTLYSRDPTTAWVVARALSEFGTTDELIDFLSSSDATAPPYTTWTLFRTSFKGLHRDPRFMKVAARFGLIDYWRESGMWPDFCAEPDLPYNCKAEAAKASR